MPIDIIYCDRILNENQEIVNYYNENHKDVDYYINNFDLDMLKELVKVILINLDNEEMIAYSKTKLKKQLIAMLLAIKERENTKEVRYTR